MTAFHFPLQKALDWRRTQLELAEARVEQQLAALAALDRARVDLESTGERTEREVRQFPALAGADLSALGSFRLAIRARAKELAAKRLQGQGELDARQAAVVEARRHCRLLERLKERRRTEWQSGVDRELDEVAADSYLAQWARRQALSI